MKKSFLRLLKNKMEFMKAQRFEFAFQVFVESEKRINFVLIFTNFIFVRADIFFNFGHRFKFFFVHEITPIKFVEQMITQKSTKKFLKSCKRFGENFFKNEGIKQSRLTNFFKLRAKI